MVIKMVYKIISEWFSKDGLEHELLVYRYNYTWNVLTTYSVHDGVLEVKFNSVGQLIAHTTEKIGGKIE